MPIFDATRSPAGCATADPFGAGIEIALVIEDDVWVADLLELLLKPVAVKVVVAADGRSGEEKCSARASAIGLVIMDCNLPDLCTLDLAARLRSVAPRVPILLTSGRTQDAILEDVKRDGPTEFLSKPFGRSELLARLKTLLGSEVGA